MGFPEEADTCLACGDARELHVPPPVDTKDFRENLEMAAAGTSRETISNLRPEPLFLPPQICAARLPGGFRRVLDDFAREILRYQPINIDCFGAEYFDQLVEKRRQGVVPVEYQPKLSYLAEQFTPGTNDRIVVPTEDQNPKGTQTTGSSHYLAKSDDEDVNDETETYEDDSSEGESIRSDSRPSLPQSTDPRPSG